MDSTKAALVEMRMMLVVVVLVLVLVVLVLQTIKDHQKKQKIVIV